MLFIPESIKVVSFLKLTSLQFNQNQLIGWRDPNHWYNSKFYTDASDIPHQISFNVKFPPK
jgi:hypothetical protein